MAHNIDGVSCVGMAGRLGVGVSERVRHCTCGCGGVGGRVDTMLIVFEAHLYV